MFSLAHYLRIYIVYLGRVVRSMPLQISLHRSETVLKESESVFSKFCEWDSAPTLHLSTKRNPTVFAFNRVHLTLSKLRYLFSMC